MGRSGPLRQRRKSPEGAPVGPGSTGAAGPLAGARPGPVLLGAAGGVLSLLTANGGGVLSLIGLIFCGVVVVVFAFRWRVPAQT